MLTIGYQVNFVQKTESTFIFTTLNKRTRSRTLFPFIIDAFMILHIFLFMNFLFSLTSRLKLFLILGKASTSDQKAYLFCKSSQKIQKTLIATSRWTIWPASRSTEANKGKWDTQKNKSKPNNSFWVLFFFLTFV